MWRCSHRSTVQLVVVGIWKRKCISKQSQSACDSDLYTVGEQKGCDLIWHWTSCASTKDAYVVCCSLLCEFPSLVTCSILLAISIEQHNLTFFTNDHHQCSHTMIIRLFVHLSYKYMGTELYTKHCANCIQSHIFICLVYSQCGRIWTECLIKMKWNS